MDVAEPADDRVRERLRVVPGGGVDAVDHALHGERLLQGHARLLAARNHVHEVVEAAGVRVGERARVGCLDGVVLAALPAEQPLAVGVDGALAAIQLDVHCMIHLVTINC